MAIAQLKFVKLSKSLQVDDLVYYCKTNAEGGYTVNYAKSKYLGAVKSITNPTSGEPNYVLEIYIQDDLVSALPTAANTYFFFIKDTSVNTSGLLGYYADIKLENDSTKKAELFSVGAQIFESSK